MLEALSRIVATVQTVEKLAERVEGLASTLASADRRLQRPPWRSSVRCSSRLMSGSPDLRLAEASASRELIETTAQRARQDRRTTERHRR